MENENNELIDSQNDTDTTENELDLDFELDSDEEQAPEPEEDERDKRIKTLEAQKEHWRQKAEKANKAPVPQATNDITTVDMYSLLEAKVPQEDISEIKEFATLKRVSISEALKSPVVKALLQEKAEQRNVANATYTGNARRTIQTVSEEVLMANASKGKLPDNDADLLRLVKARKGFK